MSDDKKPKRPPKVLPAVAPWAKNAEPGVKRAILTRHLRTLEQWGYTLDDILKGWRKP
jgi:hypothetical protein